MSRSYHASDVVERTTVNREDVDSLELLAVELQLARAVSLLPDVRQVGDVVDEHLALLVAIPGRPLESPRPVGPHRIRLPHRSGTPNDERPTFSQLVE